MARMNRKKRLLLFASAGIVLLALVVVLILPAVIDVNRYHDTIESAATGALGRPVRLGRLHLSLFPRIALTVDAPALAATPAEGGGDLVSARRVEVGARLLPLLRGRLEVTGIVVREPVVDVRRTADGGWNLAGLLGGSEASGSPGDTTAPPSVPITIESLQIRDAHVNLVNVGWPQETGTLPIAASADLHLEGEMTGDLNASGTLRLTGDVPLPAAADTGEAALPVKMTITFGLAMAHGGEQVTFDPLDIDINGSVLHLGAQLGAAGGLTGLTVKPSRLDAALLRQALVAAGSAPAMVFSSPQPVEISATLGPGGLTPAAGGVPDLSARLTVHDFTFQHPSMAQPMTGVSGTVGIDGETVTVRSLAGTLGDSDIAGDLTVVGLDAPRVTFDLHSTRADFWQLFSFVGGGPAVPAPTSSPGTPLLTPLDRLQARGQIRIDTGTFQTLDFSKLVASPAIDGHRIRLDPLEMNLYGGRFAGKARLDADKTPMAFTIESHLAGLDTDALLADNLDLAGTLSGSLTASLSVAGAGADLDAILSSLSGGGDLAIVDGHIGHLEILGMLSNASGLFGEQSLASLTGAMGQEGTTFSRLAAHLSLDGATLTGRPVSLVTPEIAIDGDASLDLLAATLGGNLDVVFSETLSRTMRAENSRAASTFWDPALGRVHLPMTLSGPLDAPVPGIDWGDATTRLARRKVAGRVGGTLGKLIGGRTASPPEAAPTPAADTPSGGDATGSTLRAEITSASWSRSLLKQDLKLAGRVLGAGITTARLQVSDDSGRVIRSVDPLPEVSAFLAAAGDPASPAAIGWSHEIDGKKLLLARFPLTVTLTVAGAGGQQSQTTQRVDR
ncbi:MAG: AsmA family protein [Acidobacteriota bacterium]